ncbi:negative regulator of flagellin synthesis FlgM [Fontibacillus solani]|uniref:Negative regulator of flagellin synthesis n=2 Tax=Fontibacillus TaxID=995014 RepID=A0A1G7PL40_9BACL|nr:MULTISPECIES: flagellar biosynthesis anti-sigma factor FlgM [Fontibacillus]MBA9085772.1 negative regulator of flagellin synthesis FlgM [Fontibacillus solani]SDF86961.1 anti-sigma-28 factor, FlgM family [Fontibacillus panacisegetis]
MKINDTGRLGAINNYQRQVESQRKDSDLKSRRKDEVSISSEAKELLKAQETAQDPARVELIEDLKSRVSSGTYNVDAGALAEKLAPYFKSYFEK